MLNTSHITNCTGSLICDFSWQFVNYVEFSHLLNLNELVNFRTEDELLSFLGGFQSQLLQWLFTNLMQTFYWRKEALSVKFSILSVEPTTVFGSFVEEGGLLALLNPVFLFGYYCFLLSS